MQPRRLKKGGLIDRSQRLQFTFNNQQLQGYSGDSLASALLANNIHLVARSIKYHRPRGILSAGLEETSALVTCKKINGVSVVNLKATEVQLENGLIASSQNCWPGVRFDIGSLLQLFSAILNAGFYYKTFMWPKAAWHRFYEKLIRRIAGQGRVNADYDTNLYDNRNAFCDVLVIGSGSTGLSAALEAAESGESVILIEQDNQLGGSALWEQTRIDLLPAAKWLAKVAGKVEALDNLRVMTRTLAFGHYDHGCIMAVQRNQTVTDAIAWRFRANRITFACGATEQPLVFPGNDRPGIMLAASVRQYIYRYGVAPGKRAVLAIRNPAERELTRQALIHAGIEIAMDLDSGSQIYSTRGRRHVHRVYWVDEQNHRQNTNCDLVCMSGGWVPNQQLASQISAPGKVKLDVKQLLSDTEWNVPKIDISIIKGLSFLDLQNDVTRKDLELAVGEGYEHIELVKRYTTLGMGTDQGKTAWPNAIRELERISGRDISDIGHTTFRPAYSPVSIGALVGAQTDHYMTPIRRTPFHQSFSKMGCVFQTSGDWIYSRYFPKPGESMEQAVEREVLAVRHSIGCVDMSTLGKVDVKGRDALEFLSRLYINNLDTLQIGRVRYVLMLREDGILWDDGIVAHLGDSHYLITMTTANAGAVWKWMNKLLHLHWPELDVQLTSVSDHWASLAIAGPNARHLLARLQPDFEIDRDNFPFASIRQGLLANRLPCRILSVSFSGELSYEINVPAGYAVWLFEQVMHKGVHYDIAAYGLEALDILRIEKGHISVGTEIDGRTTPADLGLGGMQSKSKSFIGSSLLQRPALGHSNRKKLVGLTPADGHSPIPVASHLCHAPWQPGTQPKLVGNLTASIFSPTLQQPIALALLENGQSDSQGKLWVISPLENRSIEVTVVPPCFVDPKGERLHG